MIHLWVIAQPLFILAIFVVLVFNTLVPQVQGTPWWPWFRRKSSKKIYGDNIEPADCIKESDRLLDESMAYADEGVKSSKEQGEHAKEMLDQATKSEKEAQKRVNRFNK
jgi:hypothetical protein